MRGELAASSALFSSPGRELLERRLDDVKQQQRQEQKQEQQDVPPPASLMEGKAETEEEALQQLEKSPTSAHSRASEASVDQASAVQELITCKMLLARMASDLQEEQHIVSVLSAQNRKYALRVRNLV